jgi:hypothetical protein
MLTARHHLVANHSAGEGVETQNAIDVFRVNRDGLTRALPKREASAVATHIQLLVVALSAARGGLSLGRAPLRAAADISTAPSDVALGARSTAANADASGEQRL